MKTITKRQNKAKKGEKRKKNFVKIISNVAASIENSKVKTPDQFMMIDNGWSDRIMMSDPLLLHKVTRDKSRERHIKNRTCPCLKILAVFWDASSLIRRI